MEKRQLKFLGPWKRTKKKTTTTTTAGVRCSALMNNNREQHITSTRGWRGELERWTCRQWAPPSSIMNTPATTTQKLLLWWPSGLRQAGNKNSNNENDVCSSFLKTDVCIWWIIHKDVCASTLKENNKNQRPQSSESFSHVPLSQFTASSIHH